MDLFCFGRGWGHDIIEQVPDGDIWLEFGDGIARTELTVGEDGGNAVVTNLVSGDSIVIIGWTAEQAEGRMRFQSSVCDAR